MRISLLFILWSLPGGLFAQSYEALKIPGVQSIHERGVQGKGMRVAVLDSGFRGYREHSGKNLPLQLEVRSFREDGDLEAKSSLHGLLCAEIVHRVAPEAELLLANWEPDSPKHFLKAVQWAKDQGAKIISCSMVMPGWSDGRGHGSVHEELQVILGNTNDPKSVLFIAAVGNLAQRHWQGDFHDDGRGFHEWKRGKSEQELVPWGGAAISVEISSASPEEYRLHIEDRPEGIEVGKRFPLPAKGIHGHALRFLPEVGHHYRLRVERLQEKTEPFRLIVLGASLEVATRSGSVVFPADGENVLGVGAVDEKGNRLAYSGCGSLNNKPDCVASVPFPTRIEAGFSGTSAATPQVAGLAALYWSLEKDPNPEKIRSRILRSCQDLGEVGVDCETGHGQVRFK